MSVGAAPNKHRYLASVYAPRTTLNEVPHLRYASCIYSYHYSQRETTMRGTTGAGPLIGVTAKHGHAEWLQKNTVHYLNALAGLEATAVVLSPDQPAIFPDGSTFVPDAEGRLPVEILDQLDGLILAGGGDVHPRYFGQELNGADPKSIDLRRDELELTLARVALAADLPLFGICRGCQVLNVAAGGGMVQDLPGHRSSTQEPRLHGVAVTTGSHVHEIVGAAALQVNTYHHQGVDLPTLAPTLQPAAAADPDSWLLEAFESREHRWVIGVQWHPERLFELPEAHARLWKSFIGAARW